MIENDLMVRPTLVRLEGGERRLSDLLKDLGDRSGIVLSAPPELGSLAVTPANPGEPMPFWTALDAACRAGGVQFVGNAPGLSVSPSGVRTMVLPLYRTVPGSPSAPSQTSGPFRVTLLNLSYHKSRSFGGTVEMPQAQGGIVRGLEPGAVGTEQFQATFQVLAEPRMAIALAGPSVRLIDAIDDKGQSLQVPIAGNTIQNPSGYMGYDVFGGLSLQVQATLHYPDAPGRTIRRLKGTIPLIVSSRKDDPLVIPLAEPTGRTYRQGDMSLTVHEVKPEPSFPGQTNIDLTVRSMAPSNGNQGMFNQEFQAFRGPGQPQSQFEIVDGRGRPIAQWYVTSQTYGPEGLRMTIRATSQEKAGSPAQIRYYELARATTEAEFDFNDVPMP